MYFVFVKGAVWRNSIAEESLELCEQCGEKNLSFTAAGTPFTFPGDLLYKFLGYCFTDYFCPKHTGVSFMPWTPLSLPHSLRKIHKIEESQPNSQLDIHFSQNA